MQPFVLLLYGHFQTNASIKMLIILKEESDIIDFKCLKMLCYNNQAYYKIFLNTFLMY